MSRAEYYNREVAKYDTLEIGDFVYVDSEDTGEWYKGQIIELLPNKFSYGHNRTGYVVRLQDGSEVIVPDVRIDNAIHEALWSEMMLNTEEFYTKIKTTTALIEANLTSIRGKLRTI